VFLPSIFPRGSAARFYSPVFPFLGTCRRSSGFPSRSSDRRPPRCLDFPLLNSRGSSLPGRKPTTLLLKQFPSIGTSHHKGPRPHVCGPSSQVDLSFCLQVFSSPKRWRGSSLLDLFPRRGPRRVDIPFFVICYSLSLRSYLLLPPLPLLCPFFFFPPLQSSPSSRWTLIQKITRSIPPFS